jgi:preprotein translocase subunit SecF
MPNLEGKRHTLKDLYHERTNFDFLHRRWRWVLLSGVVLLAGLFGLIAHGGLNLGIDFTGGTAWQFTVQGHSPSSGDVRDVLKAQGINDSKVVIVGNDTVRVQANNLKPGQGDGITTALAKYANIKAADVSKSDVGPTWGQQVSSKALRALVAFFVLISLYLAIRFEVKMAGAAVVAVIHDIAITIGVYAITGFEVTPATVIAFLTILGFSLYDTVVVFDKIKENEPQLTTVKGLTYTEMANRSLNEVLMRSLNTSFVALLPVASLLIVGVGFYGALALRDFGLALFIGLLTGAYSSIFVATPVLAAWKEREPRYRALQERSTVRAGREVVDVPATVAADTAADDPAVPAPVGATPATGAPVSTAVITPRPRQQKARKRK